MDSYTWNRMQKLSQDIQEQQRICDEAIKRKITALADGDIDGVILAENTMKTATIYQSIYGRELAELVARLEHPIEASPAPAETITDLDPAIWGNSPDESEVPDTTAAKLTVRDILDQIHTAARDHRQDVPGARDAHYILAYIGRKVADAHALKMHGKQGYARTLQHIHAIRTSTSDPSKRLQGIEKVISLLLTSQAVQS